MFIKEMVRYLIDNNFNKFLEVYMTKISPQNSSKVIAQLIDLGSDEHYIKTLLNTIGSNCNIDDMVF